MSNMPENIRRMWEEAANIKSTRPEPRFPDGVIIDGPRKPPRTTDEFGRPLPPKPWTPGDEDRRKPKGDKYPSPRPETTKAENLRRFPPKPHTVSDTPPSIMHDKKDIKGYASAAKPAAKPPVNNINKSDSIKHNTKSYNPKSKPMVPPPHSPLN